MALGINTNVASLNAQRQTNKSQMDLSSSIQRLSSGLRINSAKDDAAGLAIAERFTSQIRGSDQAARNANDAISLTQTADGAMSQSSGILQRIRELAVQSANATNSTTDRAALQTEAAQLTSELDRIATSTQFNGVNLLDGSFSSQQFQVGANANQTISVSVGGMRTSQIGANVNTSGDASTSVSPGAAAAGGTYTLASSTNNTYAATRTITGAASSAAMTDVTINGKTAAASSSYTGSATGQGSASAYAKAAAINASGISGVSATATNTVTFGTTGGTAGTADFITLTGGAVDASGTYSLQVNGVSVMSKTWAAAATVEVSIDEAVTAINAQSANTGVTAARNSSGQLEMTSIDGRDIQIGQNVSIDTDTAGALFKTAFGRVAQTAAGTAATLDTTAAPDIYRGTVKLQSTNNVALGGTVATIGFSSTSLSATGSVAGIDISTVAGANSAILAVDSALSSINSSRANLGAIQSRFDNTISNLQATSENLSAARGRIQDTDFAAETAKLSKAQILQQASTAMLAQANQLPQGVLSLLRG